VADITAHRGWSVLLTPPSPLEGRICPTPCWRRGREAGSSLPQALEAIGAAHCQLSGWQAPRAWPGASFLGRSGRHLCFPLPCLSSLASPRSGTDVPLSRNSSYLVSQPLWEFLIRQIGSLQSG
jgi:hypothetical protein